MLDGALASFAGSVAADELSAGPYGVLAVVDKRQAKRRLSAVLDHDPTHPDSTLLWGRLQTALTARRVVLPGMTTAGSPRYPEPIRTVFGDVAQPLGTFHVLKALPQGIRRALAAVRSRVAHSKPKWPRGRPSSTEQPARRVARQRKQRQEQMRGVCQGRVWLVNRRRKPSERQPWLSIPRGLPP